MVYNSQPFAPALAAYQQARDAFVQPLYNFTVERPTEGVSAEDWIGALRRVMTDSDYLSTYIGFMAAVTPAEALKDTLFCTGPKSGSPAATIFSRCQFSLNQPRLSPWTGSSQMVSPGIVVERADNAFPYSVTEFAPFGH